MQLKGLFNKEVLDKCLEESTDFNDLRDQIYMELLGVAFVKMLEKTPHPTRSSVADFLKINRTTLVEMCKRLGVWTKHKPKLLEQDLFHPPEEPFVRASQRRFL